MSKPRNDIILTEESIRIPRLLKLLGPLLDLLVQIAILAEVHDNAELASLGLKDIAIAYYEIVIENLQDLRLHKALLPLLLIHFRNIDLLEDPQLLRGGALDEVHLAEGAPPDRLHLTVLLVLVLLLACGGGERRLLCCYHFI